MSGHSKFANIKHKKEKNDAAKGKIFTIIGREIAVAVKEGGPDPENNSRLRDVIAKAKSNNMPNDTIERGIKKAAGEAGSVNYEYVSYEGYGPNGIAIIVDALTDNKNRTAANVRSAFTKGNGSVGTPGCVSYMFDEKGQIIIDKEELSIDGDELMMIALDGGAEDFNEEDDSFEVLTSPDDFSAVREALEKENIPLASAEVTMIPQTYVELSDEQLANVEGGVWDFASNRLYDDSWEEVLLDQGTLVVWRENGVLDHWAKVTGYEYDGNGKPLYFDLDLVNEPYIVTNVPANEVLMDFVYE